jgi:hypothetical protein
MVRIMTNLGARGGPVNGRIPSGAGARGRGGERRVVSTAEAIPAQDRPAPGGGQRHLGKAAPGAGGRADEVHCAEEVRGGRAQEDRGPVHEVLRSPH